MTDGIGSQPDEPADLAEIEALLAELDVGDLSLAAPPPSVWSGIERELAAEPLPVVAIDTRRRLPRRLPRRWLAVAAAVIVLAVAGVLVVADRDDSQQVLSSAVLVHDPAAFDPRGADAAATAELVQRDGGFEIRLSAADLPVLADQDLELWLIEPDASGNPVDVAPVAVVSGAGAGTYAVPPGLDPSTHYVVDISIEPRDGDAGHSGQSILRGALES